MQNDKYIVISLGGSIVVPDMPDPVYLKNFISLINHYVSNGNKFVIVVGGGKTCRNYQDALKDVREVTNNELDILGVQSTVFNAEFVRLAFGNNVYDKVMQGPDNLGSANTPIVIGAGWKPGSSTDLGAILFAEKVNAKTVINLSNIDYAYDKDPKKFPDAVKIEEANWADFRKILPEEWDPGLNAPFDPVAAKKAEELGLEVVIMNGKNLANLESYLKGDKFIGTIIK